MGCAQLGQRGGAGELPVLSLDMKNSFFKTLPL
jgi:hypothetical protein